MDEVKPPEATHPEKPKKGKGCKIAVIVLGILFVIVVVGGYFVCSNIEDIAKFAINKSIDAFETKILEDMPDGYDEAEVREVFEEVRTAFKEGELTGEETGLKIQEISNTVNEAFADDDLTAEELDEILDELRDLTGSIDRRDYDSE